MHETIAIVDLYRNDMRFSVGHFTIFSEKERERLHGHNFYVHTKVSAMMKNGITYDYSITRQQVLKLCRYLHEHMLLPGRSPYLKIEEDDTYYYAVYNSDNMQFLKKDTIILDIPNITSECLAAWFVTELTKDTKQLKKLLIKKIEVSISTTRGQHSSIAKEML